MFSSTTFNSLSSFRTSRRHPKDKQKLIPLLSTTLSSKSSPSCLQFQTKLRMDSQGMNSDLISNLPDNITESILARLPIRDAVRTSILSRNWRHKWTTLLELVFDAKALEVLGEDKLVKIIYRILFRHKGPIHKFFLSVRTMGSCPDIDQWITFLSRNGIREFFLEFLNGSQYKIHSSLFSCVNLGQLWLRNCIIPSPPPTFNGFNELTELKLEGVTVNNEGFENLIAKRPQLTTLILDDINGLDGLNIDDAPKLQTLGFAGSLNHICLKNTPSLLFAVISFSQLSDTNTSLGNARSISLINNLNCLSNLKVFVAGSYFLKFLAKDSIRESLPSTFKNLWKVDFTEVMFDDIDSLSSVLGLITSSPNLEELVVRACRTTYPTAEQMKRAKEYLEEKSCSIDCLRNLRYVEIENIVGEDPEMELIKLILDNSPCLELMQIEPNETVRRNRVGESKIMKGLIRFPRASKIAEIIYEDQQ